MPAGTPVQNSMKELCGIMSLLDYDKYGDEEDFAELYGRDDPPPTVEQIRALQVPEASALRVTVYN